MWFRKHPKEVRTVKGIQLTPAEWRLLMSLAEAKRLSQQSLVSSVLKEYLIKIKETGFK